MSVLGGGTIIVYDATTDDNFTKLGGSAIQGYIVSTGPIDGNIVPPYVPPEPIPDDAIRVSQTGWLATSGTDYLRFE